MILIRKNRCKTFKIFKIIKKRLTLNKPVDKSKFHLLFEVIFCFFEFFFEKKNVQLLLDVIFKFLFV
jgi:hypothetical protein